MASVLSDDIRYVKIVLLLVKGGTFSAKRLILKISTSDNKCIDDYLKSNKVKLDSAKEKNHVSKKQMKILFPSSTTTTNLECWDISLLSYVLLNLFDNKLESHEKTAIVTLREKRNELQGHPASTVMSEGQFLGEWAHITMVLYQLTKGLTTAEQDEINDTISKILKIQDFHFATNELKSFEGSDELAHIVVTEKLKCFEQRLNDCCRQVAELQASNIRVEKLQDIMARIVVTALTPAAGDTAQAKLLNALKQIVSGGQHQAGEHNQSDGDEVLTASNYFVSHMEDNGVDIVKVENGSILIILRCSTISALKNITQYLANRMYEERLKELENALSKYLGSPVKLNISIVLETLYSALEKIEKYSNNKSIMLTLKCRGLEGVKHAIDCFGNGSSTNALNNISEALSRSVGQRVELRTTIDVDKLENDTKEPEQQRGDQNIIHELQRPMETSELSTTDLLPDEPGPTESSPRYKHIDVPMVAWTKPSSSYSPLTIPQTSLKGHQDQIDRQQPFAVRQSLPTGLAFDTETFEEHDNSPALTERLDRIRSWLEGNNLSSECEAVDCITDMAYSVGTGDLKNGLVFVPASGRYFGTDTDEFHLSFVAKAAKQMKEKLHMKRILIFQLNASHGISTQKATYDDKAILYISIHEKIPWGPYPEHGESHECGSSNAEGFNINIPLDIFAGDAEYLAAFSYIVMPIALEFDPELVLVSRGFDAPISPEGFGHVISELMSLANGRVVLIAEVGHGLLSECKSADICLKCLLGKYITPIKEDQFNKLPSVDALQALEHTIKIQHGSWPCLQNHLSTIANLQSETQEKENIRQNMNADKCNFRTAFSIDTETCTKHSKFSDHTNSLDDRMRSWSERSRLVLHCELFKSHRATLKEIESYYIHSDILFGAFPRCKPTMKLSELPCGCLEDGLTGHCITVDAMRVAGCVTDMAYKVGTGEFKNGLVFVPVPGRYSRLDYDVFQLSFAAIAAKQTKEKLNMKRILIFQWNASQGMSSQRATYDDTAILYISIHNKKPLVGYQEHWESHECGSRNAEGFNVHIALDTPAGDVDYLAAFRTIVKPIARQFNPEIVFVSGGFDAPISTLCICHMISELMPLANGKVVLIAEIGYALFSLRESAEMCLKVLLGKEIALIKEDQLQKLPNTHVIQALKRTMEIQLKYWPCLKTHLTSMHNLLSEAQKEETEISKDITTLFKHEELISKFRENPYAYNSQSRRLRPGSPHVRDITTLSKDVDTIGEKTYADNALNRRLGRVGLRHGSDIATLSKNEDKIRTTAEDNRFNMKLGGVGLPSGLNSVVSPTDKQAIHNEYETCDTIISPMKAKVDEKDSSDEMKPPP